jgi:hypothetical protein
MQGPIEGNRSRRWLAALLPPALAGWLAVLLLAALWTVSLADVPGAEAPITTRSLEDGLPDIAASPGGDYLALAWSRGRNDQTGSAGYFNLDIASEAEGKWRLPVTVYPQSATDSNMAREARIAFDSRSAFSTTLHMVWNQKTAAGFSQIRYANCNVAKNANCTAAAITQTTTLVNGGSPSQPDIATDEAGHVHVVWVAGQDVMYRCSKDGGKNWESTLFVRHAVTVTQPSVAHAGGIVHIAWAEGGAGDVFDTIGYRNGADAPGDCPTSLGASSATFTMGSVEGIKDPKIAAVSSTVYLVWDVKTSGVALGGNVITYYLVYNRSTNGGLNWDKKGSAPEALDIPNGTVTFTQRSVFNNRSPYNYDYGTWLHPDVTLQISGAQTLAHVVWQESTVDWDRNEGTFNIFYTTGNGASWAAPTAVTDGTPDEGIYSVMPVVAVGQNGRLHIAYMKEKGTGQEPYPFPEDWDIYYFGLLEGPPQGGAYLPVIIRNSR